MDAIEKAMTEYHTKTCIRFIPRLHEADYIDITSQNSGCWAGIGNTGGRQEVNLQAPGCVRIPGTVIHEFMHVLGFYHEQNRPERDEFINIISQNIKPEAKGNFFKAKETDVSSYGIGYDYGSILHYSDTAFSINGKQTIVPKVQNL